MAINVDQVYKTVLLIINKEQRGYLTPDEFNKTATQVQLDIFESYFETLNQQLRVPQNDSDYANRVKTVNEKIDILKKELEKSEAEKEIIKIDNEYEECKADFETVVQMRNVFSLKTIERCIISIDDINPFADALEMDKEELTKKYYKFGQWYKNNDHPIDKLVDGESLEKLKSATSGIPKQAKLFKFTLGAFYLKFHILYVHNYNFCMTRCFCKINWSTNPVIETKNVVLHKGKLKDLDRGN